MQLERRLQRSGRPMEALQFFLDAARARLGVRALTVGTPEGWLIAGAGDEVERVAHLGARLDATGASLPLDVATWRTPMPDGDVVLTSWGRSMSGDLADSIRRILA